jgi:hypothetical protein
LGLNQGAFVLDFGPLRAIARLTQQLDVALRTTSTLYNGNNVVEFQTLTCAALNALALIALPDEEADAFGDWLASRPGVFDCFHVLKRFHFASHPGKGLLLAHEAVFDAQSKFGARLSPFSKTDIRWDV